MGRLCGIFLTYLSRANFLSREALAALFRSPIR
jgi:hypothetical protein